MNVYTEANLILPIIMLKGNGTSVAVLHLYDSFISEMQQTWHIYYSRPQEQLLLQRFFYKFRP
jgi:hypothetical protein